MAELGTKERLTRIKRAILWIRRALEITDKTDVPETIVNIVNPTLDVFGWERLTTRQAVQTATGAPTTTVFTAAFPITDPPVIRFIIQASITHFEAAVTRKVWLNKRQPSPVVEVGIPIDRVEIETNEKASMIGNTYIEQGEFLVGRTATALIASSFAIETEFIDLPIGEYIPPFSG